MFGHEELSSIPIRGRGFPTVSPMERRKVWTPSSRDGSSSRVPVMLMIMGLCDVEPGRMEATSSRYSASGRGEYPSKSRAIRFKRPLRRSKSSQVFKDEVVAAKSRVGSSSGAKKACWRGKYVSRMTLLDPPHRAHPMHQWILWKAVKCRSTCHRATRVLASEELEKLIPSRSPRTRSIQQRGLYLEGAYADHVETWCPAL